MAVVNGYATLADVKAAARITDSIDDALLEIAIESSSRDIDAYTERVFFSTGATAVARVYIPQDIYLVETDDIISVTTLKSDSTGNGTFDITWASTDFQLEPLNGRAGGIDTPATRIRAIGEYLWPAYSRPRSTDPGWLHAVATATARQMLVMRFTKGYRIVGCLRRGFGVDR